MPFFKHTWTALFAVYTVHQLGEPAYICVSLICSRVVNENYGLFRAEFDFESVALVRQVRASEPDIGIFNDIAAIFVKHLVISEQQDDGLFVEEFDMTPLAGFAIHHRVFVESALAVVQKLTVVLSLVLLFEVTRGGERIEEVGVNR